MSNDEANESLVLQLEQEETTLTTKEAKLLPAAAGRGKEKVHGGRTSGSAH